MTRPQFYLIEFRSEFLWRDDVKLRVNSQKELKQWIKTDIEDMLREFKNPYHGISREEKEEQDSKIKKIYKRIQNSPIYNDVSGLKKKLGIAYSLEYKTREGDYDDFMTYWCHRIPRGELGNFAGFREVSE